MSVQANFMRVLVTSPSGLHQRNVASPPEKVELLCTVREVLKKTKQRVFVGDRVELSRVNWTSQQGVVHAVMERKSLLWEPAIANVDHILLLFSLSHPTPLPMQMDRFLVQAERARVEEGMEFSVALSKTDLVPGHEARAWAERVRKSGYEPALVSMESSEGVRPLLHALSGRVTVLVGPSGVGKSTLINCIRRLSMSLVDAD